MFSPESFMRTFRWGGTFCSHIHNRLRHLITCLVFFVSIKMLTEAWLGLSLIWTYYLTNLLQIVNICKVYVVNRLENGSNHKLNFSNEDVILLHVICCTILQLYCQDGKRQEKEKICRGNKSVFKDWHAATRSVQRRRLYQYRWSV